VRDVFSDSSPAGIASALEEFCWREFGVGVEEPEFFDASVGSVHGLRLRDGRRIVVKVHGARTTAGFLEAVQTVQRRLAADGFPAPEPLVGPVPFGGGTAVAESLIDGGEHPDARAPAVRRAMAASLARLIELCRPLTQLAGLRANIMASEEDRLWPVPHDGRFDFEATAPGAEWLDRLAAQARRVRDHQVGAIVVGHTDWRAQHLRFANGKLTAVYDWDSLSIEREPLLVGSAAHAFTANWEESDRQQLPSLSEALAFISDYEDARGAPFAADERAVVSASLTYTMAYTARCEHSDALTDFGQRAPGTPTSSRVPAGTARAFLAEHASGLLGAEVGALP
jgi:hypothetical protein